MKLILALSAVIAVVTDAAPAIIWSSNGNGKAEHTSEITHVSSVISSLSRQLKSSQSLQSVLFLVGRDEDGNEALSRLAGSGELPTVSSMYSHADAVHHHVSGIESSRVLAKATAQTSSAEKVMEVSLEEFNRKLTSDLELENGERKSKDAKKASKRARALLKAEHLIVNVSPRHSVELDAAVSKALESGKVGNVILTAVRSTDEVKHERSSEMKRRMAMMKSQSKMVTQRRRLDDAQGNDDMDGIYYVSITPNILAGILFFLFFAFVTHIGISCMGMIQGQDVYTDKYPSIGREA